MSLTGQYGHNNGVTWNDPGYPDLRDKGSTLPVWLRGAGYRTAHVGKYLNGYSAKAAPPGWDEWQGLFGRVAYHDFVWQAGDTFRRHGRGAENHLTRVTNRAAVGVVRRRAPRPEPLFLQVDHLAPHGSRFTDRRCGNSATPDPVDRRAVADEPLPSPPSFNERDVSDKPTFVRQRPRIGERGGAALERAHGCRLASLRAVDRASPRSTRPSAAPESWTTRSSSSPRTTAGWRASIGCPATRSSPTRSRCGCR